MSEQEIHQRIGALTMERAAISRDVARVREQMIHLGGAFAELGRRITEQAESGLNRPNLDSALVSEHLQGWDFARVEKLADELRRLRVDLESVERRLAAMGAL